MLNPTERFSDRVDAYIRYRPSYPHEVIELLQDECGLTRQSVVADIGSGPGNLTALLLPVAGAVYGVEPNGPMREGGERMLSAFPNFVSVDGKAEATGLEDRSVDLITAGQAFHWFDRHAAKREFERILKPGGFVALIWNDRETEATQFLVEYEKLLRELSSEYSKVNHSDIPEEEIERFLGPDVQCRGFRNVQEFDLEGLRGRVLSSSYVPLEGEGHEELMRGVDRIFHKYEQDGHVEFLYNTEVFFAPFDGPASEA